MNTNLIMSKLVFIFIAYLLNVIFINVDGINIELHTVKPVLNPLGQFLTFQTTTTAVSKQIIELGSNLTIYCQSSASFWYKYDTIKNESLLIVLVNSSKYKYDSNLNGLIILDINLNDIAQYYCLNSDQKFQLVKDLNFYETTNINQGCLINQCECFYEWSNTNISSLKYLISINCTNRYLTNIDDYLLDSNFYDNIELFQNLAIFNLNLNFLTQITNDLFSNFKNLKQLDLSFNKIQTIQDESFENLKILQVLKLNDNLIKSINKLTFYGPTQLTQITLTNNKISSIEKEALNFSLITDLNLSRNNIQIVDVQRLNKLINLINLDLSQNLIQLLVDYSFENLNNLKTLDLSRNRIQSINKNTLYGLSNLEIISLNDNNIIDFDVNALNNIQNAKTINVENNPLKIATWILFCDRKIYVLLIQNYIFIDYL